MVFWTRRKLENSHRPWEHMEKLHTEKSQAANQNHYLATAPPYGILTVQSFWSYTVYINIKLPSSISKEASVNITVHLTACFIFDGETEVV